MASSRIVVGVDGSEGAAAAVRWCARYAPSLDAEVTAIAVIEPKVSLVPPSSAYAEAMEKAQETEREEARTKLDAVWCQPLRDGNVRYEARTAFGEPAGMLMDAAIDADLLVVGRRGRGGFLEALVGSVPRKLAHFAEVPLVIVPVAWERGA
jgi:nucleotide-binding universal stress UspA family protein